MAQTRRQRHAKSDAYKFLAAQHIDVDDEANYPAIPEWLDDEEFIDAADVGNLRASYLVPGVGDLELRDDH